MCGGKPRVEGHRIRVLDVAIWYEQMGMTPEEIVSEHPGLSLSDVFAALTFYHDNKDEIHKQIEEEQQLADELERGVLSKLGAKLHTRDVPDDL